MNTTAKFFVEYAQFRNREFVSWIEVGVMTGEEVAAWCKARGFRKEDRNDTWMASRI